MIRALYPHACRLLTGRPRRALLVAPLCWVLAGAPPTAADAPATELKRISVLETNNYRLDQGVDGLVLPQTLSEPDLAGLRAYVKAQLSPPSKTEFAFLLATTAFVHSRLEHAALADPGSGMTSLEMLRAAEHGERYSCVEYSKILADLLIAQGLPARSVGLQSSAIAYGQLGSAHVLVEVWSNSLDKWVLLDAQWGAYAQRNGVPLNVLEVYLAKASGELDQVRFLPVDQALPGEAAQSLNADYATFLTSYFGYLTARLLAGAEGVPVLLRLNGKEWPLTFQGLPWRAHLIARDPSDLYFSLNHVSLIMEFRPESQPGAEATVDFSSEEGYRIKMHEFAAVPDFEVTPRHNMPWFDHYEYAIDDSGWVVLDETSLRWTLTEGGNKLRVRAVNEAGRRGPITQIRIRYAP